MGSARTMPLHSASHWPDVSDSSPWTMSVRQAVWIHNRIPSRKTGLSCHDLWSKTECPLRKLHDVHVFGCPVCVLQKRLSDGMSMPRWERRSNRGMCVGMSERHAGNAPPVLNFDTGDITAQWNLVFDDWFTTVTTNVDDMPKRETSPVTCATSLWRVTTVTG